MAFIVWALVGASALGWLLKTTATSQPVPAHALAVDTAPSPRSDLVRLFGPAHQEPAAAPTVASTDARFKLIGVVAPRGDARASRGLALIAVDGKPARAFRVGAAVDGQTVLLAVRARAADLGAQGSTPALTLELAPLAPAATGSLSAGRAVPAAPTPVPAATAAEVPQPSAAEPAPQPAVPQALPLGNPAQPAPQALPAGPTS
jgi:general secretion pathway protein C